MKKDPPNTILVVEDDDAHRGLLLTLLRSAGYSGLGASDAEAALQILDDPEQAVDVVLCDLVLAAWPGAGSTSGVDLLRQWKKRQPATPFIFVTGVFDIAQVVEAVKLGAEDYITKPYVATELLHRVSECIDASQGDAALHDVDDDRAEIGEHLDLFNMSLDQLERVAIEGALRRFGGNRTHAANGLGISVRTLQRKLKAWTEVESGAETVPSQPAK